MVTLLIAFASLDLLGNVITSFFTWSSSLFMVFSIRPGLDAWNAAIFAVNSIPEVVIIVAAIVISRSSRWRRPVCVVVGALSVLAAVSGLIYLLQTLPHVVSEDLLYLTHSGENTQWRVEGTSAYITSLLAYRLLLTKSILKGLVELISPFAFLNLLRQRRRHPPAAA